MPSDMMSQHMGMSGNGSFNPPAITMSPTHGHPRHGSGLSHQFRPPVHTQTMALYSGAHPHHLMMPHHPAGHHGPSLGQPHGHHPSQGASSLMNPNDIASHMLGHTC